MLLVVAGSALLAGPAQAWTEPGAHTATAATLTSKVNSATPSSITCTIDFSLTLTNTAVGGADNNPASITAGTPVTCDSDVAGCTTLTVTLSGLPWSARGINLAASGSGPVTVRNAFFIATYDDPAGCPLAGLVVNVGGAVTGTYTTTTGALVFTNADALQVIDSTGGAVPLGTTVTLNGSAVFTTVPAPDLV